jgi:RES domain-containing protein
MTCQCRATYLDLTIALRKLLVNLLLKKSPSCSSATLTTYRHRRYPSMSSESVVIDPSSAKGSSPTSVFSQHNKQFRASLFLFMAPMARQLAGSIGPIAPG